jgi:hypothetical protein
VISLCISVCLNCYILISVCLYACLFTLFLGVTVNLAALLQGEAIIGGGVALVMYKLFKIVILHDSEKSLAGDTKPASTSLSMCACLKLCASECLLSILRTQPLNGPADNAENNSITSLTLSSVTNYHVTQYVHMSKVVSFRVPPVYTPYTALLMAC